MDPLPVISGSASLVEKMTLVYGPAFLLAIVGIGYAFLRGKQDRITINSLIEIVTTKTLEVVTNNTNAFITIEVRAKEQNELMDQQRRLLKDIVETLSEIQARMAEMPECAYLKPHDAPRRERESGPRHVNLIDTPGS